jgi:hypothetical protein
MTEKTSLPPPAVMVLHPAWTKILAAEHRHGRERILVADWLDWADWSTDTIITRDGPRVRLVLLNARRPGTGAMTRLVEGIEAAGLMPVMVEPNQRLAEWCLKRGWRERIIDHDPDRHRIFHPRGAHD